MLEAAAAGGALGIFLSVIFQLQIQDLLGGIHGPLPEFHVCRRTQKGAVLVEEAEAVGHGIILRLIPGLAGTVGLNIDAVAAVPTMPAGENVVHGGGGDDLPDGLPNHVLLPLGQKVAVVLVDIRDDAILVHHDEAVLGLVQKLLKNQPVPMILRHAGSPLSARCCLRHYKAGLRQNASPSRPVRRGSQRVE